MNAKTSKHMKKFNLGQVESDGYGQGTDKIVCPICGEEWEAEWDDSESAPFENMDWDCIECGGEFLVDCEPEVSYTFTSRKYSEVAE